MSRGMIKAKPVWKASQMDLIYWGCVLSFLYEVKHFLSSFSLNCNINEEFGEARLIKCIYKRKILYLIHMALVFGNHRAAH